MSAFGRRTEAPMYVEKSVVIDGCTINLYIFVDRPKSRGFFCAEELSGTNFYDEDLSKAIKSLFTFEKVTCVCYLSTGGLVSPITLAIEEELLKFIA